MSQALPADTRRSTDADRAPGQPVIQVANLGKAHHTPGGPLTVLTDISFSLHPGESLAIVGPSGSGKTTLLGLCAGLDTPTHGTVSLLDTPLHTLSEDGRAAFRGRHVGFVFQNFQLIPTLTALENVMVPLELLGQRDADSRARSLLTEVGLQHRTDHYPIQLSGGEQQRVALARAFINSPTLLFADEPTGNLDGSNGGHVVDLLFDLNHKARTTLILVTHDLELASRCAHILHLRDGQMEAHK